MFYFNISRFELKIESVSALLTKMQVFRVVFLQSLYIYSLILLINILFRLRD